MLKKYIPQQLEIEQEWYTREPKDNILKNKLVKWFDKDDEINVIRLKAVK